MQYRKTRLYSPTTRAVARYEVPLRAWPLADVAIDDAADGAAGVIVGVVGNVVCCVRCVVAVPVVVVRWLLLLLLLSAGCYSVFAAVVVLRCCGCCL